MKLKFVVNDIASLLVDFYIKMTGQNQSASKRSIMNLHMKQAITSTYEYAYEDLDEVWQIDVYNLNTYTYELNHDVEYDPQQMRDVVEQIRCRLDSILDHILQTDGIPDYDRPFIGICCVPFDGISITIRDIISLLDIDCM